MSGGFNEIDKEKEEMRKILFDKNKQDEMEKKGYTIVQLLSNDGINYIIEELSQLHPDDGFEPKDSSHNYSFHFTFFDTNTNYRRKTNHLIHSLFLPHIKRILVDYKILAGNFFVKPAGEGELHVHQNWDITKNRKDTTVAVWCPLLDVDESNGTIHVVEGSHKLVPNITTHNTTPFFNNFAEALMHKYSIPIRLKAGEALIFDDSLIHWSPKNKSSAPRFVAHAVCIPAEATPVFYYLDQNTPGKNFELFELNNEFFIDHSQEELYSRPQNLKSLGFIENKNCSISESEFLELFKNGDEIRRKIYYPELTDNINGKSSFLNRIKRIFEFSKF